MIFVMKLLYTLKGVASLWTCMFTCIYFLICIVSKHFIFTTCHCMYISIILNACWEVFFYASFQEKYHFLKEKILLHICTFCDYNVMNIFFILKNFISINVSEMNNVCLLSLNMLHIHVIIWFNKFLIQNVAFIEFDNYTVYYVHTFALYKHASTSLCW